jgi:hypothetical protein
MAQIFFELLEVDHAVLFHSNLRITIELVSQGAKPGSGSSTALAGYEQEHIPDWRADYAGT